MRAQRVAGRVPDDIILEDVGARLLSKVGQPEAGDAFQSLPVSVGDGAPVCDPFRQVTEFHIEHGRLHIVQQSGLPVEMILSGVAVLAVVSQQAHDPSDLRIIGRHGTAVAESTEDLEGIEAEAAGRPERPGPSPTELRPEGLGGVLDNDHPMPFGDWEQPVHITEPAVEVHGQDGPRARGNGALHLLGIHGVVIQHVDENGRGAAVDDRGHGRHERVPDGDHLVAGGDSGRHQGEVQRVIAAVDPDGVACPDKRGEVLFEGAQLLPVDEVAARQAVHDRRIDLALEPRVMGARVHKGHLIDRHASS
jgi:hypothetical protein